VKREAVYSPLAIKVQGEFVGSRAQAHGVKFNLTLVADVGFKEVCCEHIAFEQEVVIGFERLEHCTE
jgi:hypothetical protein